MSLYLRSLSRVKPDSGFSLIELLVVTAILGILAAIAVPSYLGIINRARESEAKSYIGAINRAQQDLLFEEGKFGTLEELGNPIPTSTQSYLYTVTAGATQSVIIATPKTAALPPISGLVEIEAVGTTGKFTTRSAICPGTLTPTIGCR